MIRNKQTNQSSGYGFVAFGSVELARRALETLNGTMMPGTNTTFKLNYSTGAANAGLAPPPATEHPIFVGDLSREVNDHMLLVAFQEKFQTVKSAKVVMDPLTNCSKGYGFIRFGSEQEANRFFYFILFISIYFLFLFLFFIFFFIYFLFLFFKIG